MMMDMRENSLSKKTDNPETMPEKTIKIRKDSGRSWLTLFYSLPRELIEKRPVYLELPRCPYEVLRTDKYDGMIESDTFLELVWDCMAWSAWQYMEVPYQRGGYHEIPGNPGNYSGDFPLWRLSYSMLPLLREKYETSGFSFRQLYNMPPGMEVQWLTYQQFGNLMGTLVPEIIREQNWQPVIDEIWNCRAVEDFDLKNSRVKMDFMRSWEHSRTSTKTVSLEELSECDEDGESCFDIPDTRAEFETSILSDLQIAEFTSTFSERDRNILRMKMEGYTAKEIAEAVGYKTHSAVVKRISQIADRYEDFASEEYRKYLNSL